MGKSTISMAIFDSKLLVYQRVKHPKIMGKNMGSTSTLRIPNLEGLIIQKPSTKVVIFH
jgi:hypothetical protein